ncbi:uncharacterized protein Z519_04713 [Cladophialophora bantiana CBS 173.52]|uniref:Uncharacterized protein n=1 Tax=Cladophialophora bantiana (strain ATCC 10958 / CBS 173.52 / CDC B-1940 / NIH 8579) TaxID=1442370 RepID=A0A0D2EXN4_CLAB1|nr:uncharacterized protein Z519_04713 [Cladophialophora bantiana CBS 173.52]KIW94736.1 hypothetical protein Z519_04713 [Cladophialophora bantiana CBS 173.52]
MVRLFEEMSYRDGVVYFLPIYNWFCVVDSVTQIYQHHAVQTKRKTVAEELDIIRDILKQLQSKWPSAIVVLDWINWIVSSDRAADEVVVHFSKAQPASIHEEDGVEEPYLGSLTLKTLFPFPPSMCPNMNLLTKGSATEHQSGISHSDLPDNDFLPGIFDDMPTNAGFFDIHHENPHLSNSLSDTFD